MYSVYKPYYAGIEDLEDIKGFYQKLYPKHIASGGSQLVDWLYFQNPLQNKEKISVVLVRDAANHELIAHEGLYHDLMKIGGQCLTVTWGTDLIVDPLFRRRGIAREMHSFIHQHEDIYIAIAMARSTFKLLKQFKYELLAPVYTYVAILDQAFFTDIKYYPRLLKIKLGIIGKLLFAANSRLKWNLFKYWLKRYQVKKAPVENSIKSDISNAHLLDPVFQAYRKKYEGVNDYLHIYSHDIIRWKFINQPGKEFSLFLLHEDKVSGYIILRIHQSVSSFIGIISDLVADSNQGYDALLSFAKYYFSSKGCHSVFVLATKKMVIQQLKQQGFYMFNRRIPMVISNKFPLHNLRKKRFDLNFESHDLDRIFNFRP
jgi:GNAT superfamily N-acetyltransferase